MIEDKIDIDELRLTPGAIAQWRAANEPDLRKSIPGTCIDCKLEGIDPEQIRCDSCQDVIDEIEFEEYGPNLDDCDLEY